MKKFCTLLFLFLTISLFNSLEYVSATELNNSENILHEKFMLSENPVGSKWLFHDTNDNDFLWTLSEIIYDSNSTVKEVFFKCHYSYVDEETKLTDENYYLIRFTREKDFIYEKVWNPYYNSFVQWKISDLKKFSVTDMPFYVLNVFSDLSLKYIHTPDFQDSIYELQDKEAQKNGLGTTVFESTENDAVQDWYHYIDSKDPFYENGINHVSLMVLDWISTDGYTNEIEPLHNFSENSILTEKSFNEILSSYTKYHSYSSKEITKDILKKELNKGNIIALKIDPSKQNLNNDPKSCIGRYYAWKPHYLVIKGYSKVDANDYFTVFNPISSLSKNTENLKGKNRYYLSDDILDSICSDTQIFVITSK